MIGNGNPVSVTGEVAQDMLGAAEGRFEIDHPVLAKSDSAGESSGGDREKVLRLGLRNERAGDVVSFDPRYGAQKGNRSRLRDA
jgi:hypothetical protein